MFEKKASSFPAKTLLGGIFVMIGGGFLIWVAGKKQPQGIAALAILQGCEP